MSVVATIVSTPQLRRAWFVLRAIILICIVLLFLHVLSVLLTPESVESLISAIIFTLGAFFVDAVSRLSLRTAQDMLRVETLAEAAYVDPLTGIGNLRRFSEALDSAVSQAGPVGLPLSVFTMDIDHFKQVNDTYGHAVGDRVLKEVGAILEANVRVSDVVCRVGGEEFAVLLPRLEAGGAVALAERVRAAVAAHSIDTGGGDALRVTVSVGFAALLRGEDSSDLLRRADEALYEAKRSGRDRVKIAA